MERQEGEKGVRAEKGEGSGRREGRGIPRMKILALWPCL